MKMKPTSQITQITVTLRVFELMVAIAFAVPMAPAQTIVNGTWYNAYNESHDFSEQVGYTRYGYLVAPTAFADAGFDGVTGNVAGDLLPNGNEVTLGDPNDSVNPNSKNVYSAIWNWDQLSTTATINLVVFELDGLSTVSGASLVSYFHNNGYNVPQLTFAINTSDSLESASWTTIGTYAGMAYDSSGTKSIPDISLDDSISGYHVRISALSNLGDPPARRTFALSSVTLDAVTVPEPGITSLVTLSIGLFVLSRRRKVSKA